jgi:hypothetical protein
MADIRLTLDEVRLCIKDAQLILHGVRCDASGQIVDHIDIALPWNFQQTLARLQNFDGMDYLSLDGETA